MLRLQNSLINRENRGNFRIFGAWLVAITVKAPHFQRVFQANSLASGTGNNFGESGNFFAVAGNSLWEHGKPREFEMSISRLPENVTDIAVLVQSAGQGAILGAVAQPIR